jgi:hypothetical protein
MGAEWDDRAFEESSFEFHELRSVLVWEERHAFSDTLTRLLVSSWFEPYSSMILKLGVGWPCCGENPPRMRGSDFRANFNLNSTARREHCW